MAYRELHVVEIREFLRLWCRGHSLRAVARLAGVDRKTVRRHVEAAQALGFSREADSRPLDDELIAEVCAAVDPARAHAPGLMRAHCCTHRALIEGWLQEGCRGPKIVKLLGRHTGVVVPLRTLQRFIREELTDAARAQTMRVADPPAGQVLEVDFLELGDFEERESGRRRKLSALLCTAAYSRHQFVWPCLSQGLEDVIEGLEAAWAFFGGVFPVVVTDNLKAVIVDADALNPRPNPTFLQYAQHRDFELDPARVRKPRDKARVERQVRYVRDDLFKGERFGSLEEIREAAPRWCLSDAGARIHGTTRRQPLAVFEAEERPLLKPAPSAPYDTPTWHDITLGRDQTIVVGKALYSVPYTLAPGPLRVCLERATVKIYRKRRLVKVHPRAPIGGSQLDPADYPPGKAEVATRSAESLQQMADAQGEHISEYARRLLEGPALWRRIRHVYRLLALPKRYGVALVDRACAQALALDVVDVARITRILERQLVEQGALEGGGTGRPQKAEAPKILRFERPASEYSLSRGKEEEGDDAPA